MLGSAPLGGAPVASAGSLKFTYTLALDPGVFRLVGDGETSSDGFSISAAPGAFVLAGQDVFLLKPTYNLKGTGGAYHIGGAGTFVRHYGLVAETGEFDLLVSATFKRTRVMPIAGGVFALRGSAAMLLNGYSVQVDPGHFALGGAAQFRTSRVVRLTPGALVATPGRATLRAGRKVPLAAGALALVASDAALRLRFAMQADVGHLQLAASPALLRASRREVGTPAVLALSGGAAALQVGRTMALRQGVFSINGTGTLARNRVAAVPPLALTLTGRDARIAATRRLAGRTGALALTGSAATLARAAAVRLDPGQFALRGAVARAAVDRQASLDPGQFVVTAAIAQLARPARVLLLDPGRFTLRGDGAGLDYPDALPGLWTGPRWSILSTISVEGDDAVTQLVSPAPLQVASSTRAVDSQGTGGWIAPLAYPIVNRVQLVIEHGLSYVPRVTITDAQGEERETDIRHGAGVVTLTFDEPMTGTATIGD